MKARVISGIDQLDRITPLLKGRRVGLMTNPTGINKGLESTIDLLHSRCNLSALLACEHGVRGDRQAGEKVDTFIDPDTGEVDPYLGVTFSGTMRASNPA